MNITIGPPVSSEDFFDREQLLAELWSTIQSQSVILAAPRRVGKSSLMLKIKQEPRFGFKVLWLDGEDYDGPEDLVADLAVKTAKLRDDWKGFVGKLFSKTTSGLEELEVWEVKVKLRQQLTGSWRVQGETVIRNALEQNSKLLIILDELPMLLHKLITSNGDHGKKQAQDVLDWLRHLRQDAEFFKKVRQLIGGSIGLPRIASIIGSSHKINDLRQVEVRALDRPKAKELATLLLKSRDVVLEEQVLEAFLDEVETFVPIFIQIMASVVASEVKRSNQPVTVGLIRECYQQRALGPEFRLCFEDYYERLDRYYSPEEARAARSMLRELAIAKEPLLKSSVLATYQREIGKAADAVQFDLLFTWLSDDFYLEEIAGGRVQFKSRWMRDWWRTYHATKP